MHDVIPDGDESCKVKLIRVRTLGHRLSGKTFLQGDVKQRAAYVELSWTESRTDVSVLLSIVREL